MKYLGLILISALLMGCSTTKVYLYKRYLSDDDVLLITQKIEALNYEVETNTLAFPEDVQQSFILYSPYIEAENDVDDFTQIIKGLGYSNVEVQLLVKGNHWYTHNSIGLLLIPEGVKMNDKVLSQDLVNHYSGEQCERSAEMVFNRDHTYQINYQQETNSKSEHKTGTWKISGYPYIELTSLNGSWTHYFEISKNVITDKIGPVELLELTPLNSSHVYPNCNFVYGVRL